MPDAKEAAAGVDAGAPLASLAPLHPLAPRTSFDRDAKYAGAWLDFEPDAAEHLLGWQESWRARAKELKAEGAEIQATMAKRVGDWARRIAALLTIIRCGSLRNLPPVRLSTVERAIRFVDRFAWPHAVAVLEYSEQGELEGLEEKVLRALVDRRGEWFTPGQFRDGIAKRWPEVRGETIRDRQSPLLRAFDSLHKRGLIEKRATPSGKSFEVRAVGPRRL